MATSRLITSRKPTCGWEKRKKPSVGSKRRTRNMTAACFACCRAHVRPDTIRPPIQGPASANEVGGLRISDSGSPLFSYVQREGTDATSAKDNPVHQADGHPRARLLILDAHFAHPQRRWPRAWQRRGRTAGRWSRQSSAVKRSPHEISWPPSIV